MAGDNENVIEEVAVRVSPDTTGFTEETKKQVNKKTAKLKGDVAVEPDVSKFGKSLKAKLKSVDVRYAVRLEADATGFKDSVRKALAKVKAAPNDPTYKVRLVASADGFKTSARAAIKALQVAQNDPVYKVRLVADTTGFKNSVRDAARGDRGTTGASTGAGTRTNSRAARRSADADLINERAKAHADAEKALADSDDKAFDDAMARWEGFQKRLDAFHRQAAQHEQQRSRTDTERLTGSRLAAELEQANKQYLSLQQRMDHLHRQGLRHDRQRVRSDSEKVAAAQLQAELEQANKRFLSLQQQQDHLHRRALAQELQRIRTAEERQQKDRADAEKFDAERDKRDFANRLAEHESARNEASARERSRFRDDNEYMAHLREQALREDERREERSGVRRERAERTRAARRKQFNTARKGPQLIDFGGRGFRPMNILYGAVVALSPALIAMGASAIQASTSLAFLGAAGIGAAAAITGIVVGFSRVTDVLELSKQVRAEEAAEAANAAQENSNSAQKAVRAAEAELAARDRLIDAMDAQGDARRDLIRAQEDERDAQLAVNDARREAIRDLQDLRELVSDLARDETGAELALQEALRKRMEVRRNFFSTDLERRQADQDVDEARDKVSDIKRERKTKTGELADSQRKGIEGSDKVVRAVDDAKDARDRTGDARRALERTNRNVDRARRKDPAEQDAAAPIDKVSSAAANLKKKIDALSPAAREMYYFFLDNEKVLEGVRTKIENGVLPGFTRFLRAVFAKPKGGKSTLDILSDSAATLGGKVSKIAGDLGELTQTTWFRKTYAEIDKNNQSAFDALGEAVKSALPPILRIVQAASPYFKKFADGLATLMEKFDTSMKNAEKDNSLAKWFKDAWTEAGKWWDITKNLLATLKNIFGASKQSGGSLVDDFRQLTGELAKWSGSPEGKKGITEFFQWFRDLPYRDIGNFVVQAIELATAVRITKWAVANPFWAGLGVLAASNPGALAALMEGVTSTVTTVVGFIATNKVAAGTLIALLTAYSGAKLIRGGGVVSMGVKLVGLTQLGGILAQKFKPFSDLLNKVTRTATMTVHAGVVNILGAGGAPGRPGAPGGAPRPSGRAIGGGIALFAGLSLGAYLASQIETDGKSQFQKGMTSALQGALTGASIGAIFGPVGAAAGAVIGGAVGGYLAHLADLNTAVGKERYNFQSAEGDANRYGYQTGMPANDPGVVNRGFVKDYIKSRKDSVKAEYEYIEATEGKEAADKRLAAETATSVGTLSYLLQKYGYTPGKADEYSKSVYGVAPRDKTPYQGIDPMSQARNNSPYQGIDPMSQSGNSPGWIVDPYRQIGVNSANGFRDGFKYQADEFRTKDVPKWANETTQAMRDALGIKSPSTITYKMGEELINGLVNGFVERWIRTVDVIKTFIRTALINPMQTAFTSGATGIVNAFTGVFSTIGAKLAKPVETALAWIQANVIDKVNALLGAIGVPQIPGINTPTTAVKPIPTSPQRRIPAGIGRADGGPVPGFSPNPRADNIHARLTAGEYVQPVDTVKHYGAGFMDKVRRKEIPRYAEGGLVGGLKKAAGDNLVTDIMGGAISQVGNSVKDIAATVINRIGGFFGADPGGGTVSGDATVARIAEATARAMGATDKQLLSLIMTGLVESGMRNLNYGDRDSLGYLQQRPSQGWGTPAQVMNVEYATRSFIRAAKAKDNGTISAGDLAQAVQNSGIPDAYGKREADAYAIINREAPGIGGGAPGGAPAEGVLGQMQQWARQQAGKVYRFGAVGPQNYDCSGMVGNLWAMATGNPMYRRYMSTGDMGAGKHGMVAGPGKFTVYLSRSGGHTAANIAGLHAEAYGGNGTPNAIGRIGTRLSYYDEKLHLPGLADGGRVDPEKLRNREQRMSAFHTYGWPEPPPGTRIPTRTYDTGGGLPPGYTLAFNGTGRTETVRTAQQEKQLNTGGVVRLHRADLALLAEYIAAANPEIRLDGRRVAEAVNRYQYLPAGV